MPEQLILTVSDFVAVLNQTLDFAYPTVTIIGELSNFKVSRGKWLYFDLKDDQASVRFFGTIYALPGPLEDGMKLQVTGSPRLHPNFGFSINVQTIKPVGGGSIKKAAQLLEAKLRAEGLFAPERKRPLPYPPSKIGLITSGESAAYADFVKVLAQRWGGLEIIHADVQVQGEMAPVQIAKAFDLLNSHDQIEAIVLTRGGGSADDLQAFSTEVVVRAIAASRTPTMVAIGHEIDTSLAELAADVSASTPSNAAELLVPDRTSAIMALTNELNGCRQTIDQQIAVVGRAIKHQLQIAGHQVGQIITSYLSQLQNNQQLIASYDPRQILSKGYALIHAGGSKVLSIEQLSIDQQIRLRLSDGSADAKITKINRI